MSERHPEPAILDAAETCWREGFNVEPGEILYYVNLNMYASVRKPNDHALRAIACHLNNTRQAIHRPLARFSDVPGELAPLEEVAA